MNYGATITYFVKEENGLITPHTTHIGGSKTKVFNAISDIMKEGNFIDITVVIREKGDRK